MHSAFPTPDSWPSHRFRRRSLALFAVLSCAACDTLNNAVAPLPLIGHSDQDAIELALLQADVTNAVICTNEEEDRETAPGDLVGECATAWYLAKHWIETYSAMPWNGPLLETARPTRGSRRGFTVWFDLENDPTVEIRLQQFCAIPSCAPPTDPQVEKAFLFFVATGIDLVRHLSFRP